MKKNNLEKNPGFEENEDKVETDKNKFQQGISKCRQELKVKDDNLQSSNSIETSNEASCSKIVNNHTNSDCDKKEQSHDAYVELDGDINGNNNKGFPSTDLNKHDYSTQDTNSPSEESSDSEDSIETTDSSIDKLDKRYRQGTKSKSNNKNKVSKQGSTKQNSTNFVNKMNRENYSNKVVNNKKCDTCGQFLNDPELLYYQGHPQDAVEEYVALTDDKLAVTVGKLVVHSGFYIKVCVA